VIVNSDPAGLEYVHAAGPPDAVQRQVTPNVGHIPDVLAQLDPFQDP
jgi:hypothetical protein